MDTITMSGKEAPRPGILRALCDERITNDEGAVALHLTVRQVQRLKGRYRESGAGGGWFTAAGASPLRSGWPIRSAPGDGSRSQLHSDEALETVNG